MKKRLISKHKELVRHGHLGAANWLFKIILGKLQSIVVDENVILADDSDLLDYLTNGGFNWSLNKDGLTIRFSI